MVVRGLLSITFLVGIGVINAEPLSRAENKLRNDTCGGFHLPTPNAVIEDNAEYKDTSDDTWLLTIRPKSSNTTFPITAAFLISPRHIMTSATVVIANDKHWRLNGEEVDNCCSVVARGHGKNPGVPIDVLNTLEVWDPKKPLGVEIVKGRLFHLCMRNDREYYVPLLLEISPTTNRQVPCVFGENSKDGDKLDSYGLSRGKMKHNNIELKKYYPIWLLTHFFKEGGDNRGGPLVTVHENKSYVVGLKESDPENYKDDGVYYFNVNFMEEQICEFSGVCRNYTLPDPTTTPSTTTTRRQTKRKPVPNSDSTLNPGDEDVIAMIPEDEEELDDEDPNTSNRKLEILEIMIFLVLFFYWM